MDFFVQDDLLGASSRATRVSGITLLHFGVRLMEAWGSCFRLDLLFNSSNQINFNSLSAVSVLTRSHRRLEKHWLVLIDAVTHCLL